MGYCSPNCSDPFCDRSTPPGYKGGKSVEEFKEEIRIRELLGDQAGKHDIKYELLMTKLSEIKEAIKGLEGQV